MDKMLKSFTSNPKLSDHVKKKIKLKLIKGKKVFKGNCPFNECGKATFDVYDRNEGSDSEAFYHCSACHEIGNIASWYEKTENMHGFEFRSFLEQHELCHPTNTTEGTKGNPHKHSIIYARQVWNQTIPIEGTVGERYLSRLGHNGLRTPDIRFHPKMKHPISNKYLPTIVVAVRDEASLIVGLRRLFLVQSGWHKAYYKNNEFGLGVFHQGPVHLSPNVNSKHLIITISLEDGLLFQKKHPDACVWAAMTEDHLFSFDISKEFKQLTIVSSNGFFGKKEVSLASKAQKRRGLEVEIIYPPQKLKFFYNEFIPPVEIWGINDE